MTVLAKNSRILVAAAVIFLTGAGLRAAGSKEMGYFASGAANQATTATTQVAALRSAYSALAGANHNYGNHRLLAMQAIAQACSILAAQCDRWRQWRGMADGFLTSNFSARKPLLRPKSAGGHSSGPPAESRRPDGYRDQPDQPRIGGQLIAAILPLHP